MANSSTEAFSNVLNSTIGRSQQLVEKSAQIAQEVGEIARGNAEALAIASKAATAGFESLSREAAEYGRKSFEEASEAVNSLRSVKSPTEFFQLQTELAQSILGGFVTQSNKVGDTLIELGGQIAAPLANRYVAAAERLKTAALER